MRTRRVVATALILSQITTSCAHRGPSNEVAQNGSSDRNPTFFTFDKNDNAPSETLKGTLWTDWDQKGSVEGLLAIGDLRTKLLAGNLHDPHEAGKVGGVMQFDYSGYGRTPDCTNSKFRSADGTCNDRSLPLAGAANVAFGRNVPPELIDQSAKERLLTPNPAVVSKVFFTREKYQEVPFLNMLAAVWIQFMNHDWMTHGRNIEKDPIEVETKNDTRFVERTKENPITKYADKRYQKVSINEVTHWWDGSQIYGSSQEVQDQLRTFEDGKMRLENGLLPRRNDFNPRDNKQNQGFELTGFKDNWWLGLSMFHTLFVREHNAIADELNKKHVRYDKKSGKWIWKNGSEILKFDDKRGVDEQVFQTARLVNTAVLAKIHTTEWTPAILPNPVLKTGMHVNWYGLANPRTLHAYAKWIPDLIKRTDWFKIKSGFVVGGIVGDNTNNYGTPFSITEEFTSVYRLHSLLPETLNLRKTTDKNTVEHIPFPETRNEKSYDLMASHEMKDLFYSFGTQLPGQLVLNNFPHFMQDLDIPGLGKMDLGMVDIIRDRERGVPRYNQFRKGIGLVPIKSYKDFFPINKPLDARQMAIIEKFKMVYGTNKKTGQDNVDDIDLLVGTLAEEVRPAGFGFGETMFQIFILMASRRLMADRFFTNDYRKEVYTQTGLNWVDDKGTFQSVIERHMPDLASFIKTKSGRSLGTAFEPWREDGFDQRSKAH